MRYLQTLVAALAAVLLSSPSLKAATIVLNGTYAFNATSFSGGDLPANSLALLIVDTSGNGFLNGGITSGQSFSIGSLLGGDDIIVGTLGATNTGTGSVDSLFAGSISFDIDTGSTAAADTGDQFALVWFDGATTSTSTAAVGQYYQLGRGTDWIVPTAPNNLTMGVNFTSLGNSSGGGAGQTTIAVSAVPEPSVSVLAMAGAMFAVFGRRRRRNRHP